MSSCNWSQLIFAQATKHQRQGHELHPLSLVPGC